MKTYKLKINRVMHTRCTHDISGERLNGIREVMVRIPLSLLMNSRYHCLNLNSVFQKGTVELRLFNSTTHTGNIKACIQLCMAISAQALNQRCASRKKRRPPMKIMTLIIIFTFQGDIILKQPLFVLMIASEGFISDVIDKIIPQIEDWQNRPLSEIYPVLYIDAIHYSVRDNGVIRKLAAYVVLGIKLDYQKDALIVSVFL